MSRVLRRRSASVGQPRVSDHCIDTSSVVPTVHIIASCSPLHHFYFLFIFVGMWIPYTAAVLEALVLLMLGKL